jgi:hypothetical protein
MPISAWAGTAVFKRSGRSGVRLCTLPVLALEGDGAISVSVGDAGRASEQTQQPLFYIYPDVAFGHIDEFLDMLESRLIRRRAS